MNGFLLYYSDSEELIAKEPVPKELGYAVEYTSAGAGIGLYFWGNGVGDIHISSESDRGLLILSGYVTEIKGVTVKNSQQAIAHQLRNIFDTNSSEEKLSSIALASNGSFAIVYVNFQQNCIVTLTDRISSRSLWLKTTKRSLYISSHAIPIARFSSHTKVEPSGIAAHLLYGTTVDPTKGIFQGIYCQQEGVLEIYNIISKSRKKILWYRYQHTPDNSRTLRSWIKLTSNCFVESAKRISRTVSNPVLFLSGGVDSRVTGAALLAAGIKPLLCTLTDTDNLETKVAKAVAHVFHCDHEIVLRDEEWYLRAIPGAMFNSHGVYSWTHSHFSQIFSKLRKTRGVDAAILGDFCEAFSKSLCLLLQGRSQVWTPGEFIDEFDEIQLPNYQPFDRQRTLELLQADFAATARAQLRQDILARYESVANVSSDPLIVGDYFFRWQAASSMATFQMFNDVRSAGAERNLMFDTKLHHLLEVMPSAIRFDSSLGARVVNHLSPLSALIPNANTLLPLLAPKWGHSFAKKVKPVLGKLRRRLLSNTYKTTGSWPHLPLLYSGNAHWKKYISENFMDDSQVLPTEVFNRSVVEKRWKMFCDGDISCHSDIERLLGLAQIGRFIKS